MKTCLLPMTGGEVKTPETSQSTRKIRCKKSEMPQKGTSCCIFLPVSRTSRLPQGRLPCALVVCKLRNGS